MRSGGSKSGNSKLGRLPGSLPSGLSRKALKEHSRDGEQPGATISRSGSQPDDLGRRMPSIESVGFSAAASVARSNSLQLPTGNSSPSLGASLANRQPVSPHNIMMDLHSDFEIRICAVLCCQDPISSGNSATLRLMPLEMSLDRLACLRIECVGSCKEFNHAHVHVQGVLFATSKHEDENTTTEVWSVCSRFHPLWPQACGTAFPRANESLLIICSWRTSTGAWKRSQPPATLPVRVHLRTAGQTRSGQIQHPSFHPSLLRPTTTCYPRTLFQARAPASAVVKPPAMPRRAMSSCRNGWRRFTGSPTQLLQQQRVPSVGSSTSSPGTS